MDLPPDLILGASRRHPPRLTRRGAVAVAMVMTLVMLELTIVASVIGQSRHQNLTVQRVGSLRAAYAAEAGINMALRELAVLADEDGDGAIGTISNNGNPADNPAAGGGTSIFVTKTLSGPTILTSTATAGTIIRTIQVTP